MNKMEVTGITNSKERIPLKQLIALDWQSDRFTPADSLEIVCLDVFRHQRISRIEAKIDGVVFFSGIVDQQQSQVDRTGICSKLSCRSWGALLLDNEARPGTYWSLSAEQLVRAHGMGVVKRDMLSWNPVLQQVTVQKGCSHWEVICYFCRRAFGCTPFLGRDRQLLLQPFTKKKHLFSNGLSTGIHYHSASFTEDRYRMLSKVWIKDHRFDGYYGKALENKAAQVLGVQRERYYHPGTLWGEQDLWKSAEFLVKEHQLDYLELDLVLPGYFDLRVGDLAEFQDQQLGNYSELYIAKLAFHWGADGISTRVKLWDKMVV